MQKTRFSNSKGLSLAGVWYPAESKKAIIIAHGFTSNKDRPRFVELAEQLNQAGFAVLRFDFSGCGESDSAQISVNGETDDLKSAIRFVQKKEITQIGLLGESLGGLVSLMAYSNTIQSMVLWAPVTNKRDMAFELQMIGQVDSKYEDRGEFVVQKRAGREFRISKEYFNERANIDQKQLLKKIQCLVLIIHGDKDQTVPLQWSQNALAQLSTGSKMEILPGAGHHLAENPADVQKAIQLSVDWFKSHL